MTKDRIKNYAGNDAKKLELAFEEIDNLNKQLDAIKEDTIKLVNSLNIHEISDEVNIIVEDLLECDLGLTSIGKYKADCRGEMHFSCEGCLDCANYACLQRQTQWEPAEYGCCLDKDNTIYSKHTNYCADYE